MWKLHEISHRLGSLSAAEAEAADRDRNSGKGSVFSTLFYAVKRQRQHAADVKFVVQVEVVVDVLLLLLRCLYELYDLIF